MFLGFHSPAARGYRDYIGHKRPTGAFADGFVAVKIPVVKAVGFGSECGFELQTAVATVIIPP